MTTRNTQDAIVVDASQEAEGEDRMISRRTLIKIGWTAPVVAMVMTPRNVFAGSSTQPGGLYCGNKSTGFYKTCDADDWALQSFVIGGKTYTADEAQQLLIDNPAGGDKWLNVFHQLVAAELNQEQAKLKGVTIPGDVQGAITQLDTWMKTHNQGEHHWDNITSQNHDLLYAFNQDEYCW